MVRLASILMMALTLCGPARAQPSPVQHMEVGGLSRAYLLDRFGAGPPQGRLPIVIYLHGLGASITDAVPARFDIPFAAEPGMEPALIVRPQGVHRQWDTRTGRISRWSLLATLTGGPADDIAFMRALIAHLVADENGDPARVYVAGVSAGGYLAARVACEMGGEVAAVADVIATAAEAVLQSCNPRPVPFALLASTTDETDPYAGTGGSGRTRLVSAPEMAFFFAQHNGCATRSETPLPHAGQDGHSTVSLIRFSGCTDDAEVLFYRVDGSGHSVPSMAPAEAAGWDASGRRNRDMETGRALWAFFRAHRLAPVPAEKR